MSDIIQVLLAAAPGLLAAGGLLVKVNRLERDVDARVSRELFDLHMKSLEKELAEIKTILLARITRRSEDTTDPGR